MANVTSLKIELQRGVFKMCSNKLVAGVATKAPNKASRIYP